MRSLSMLLLLGCNPEPEDSYADDDGDGFTSQYDCDDADATVFPTADEVCDGVDNNCDGNADESSALDSVTVFADADSDGFGNESSSTTACEPPPGFIATSGDCDDTDASAYPGNTELCDGVDNDCNGEVDDDPADATVWVLDADGDGYGAGEPTQGCAPGSSYVSTSGDCDDSDAAIRPGANEVCQDGKVNNCDSTEAEAIAACAWSGTFSESNAMELISTSGHAGWSVVAADLTGDGTDDLVVGVPGANNARLIEGPQSDPGGLTLIASALQGGSGSAAGAALAAGDLDGDGYTDLIVGGPGASSVWLLAGPITGGVSLGAGTVSDGSWLGTATAAADVDGDGFIEAILGDPAEDAVVIVDHTGAVEATLSGSDAGAVLSSAGDVNGDGIEDLLVGAPARSDAWLVLGPISGDLNLSDAIAYSGSGSARAGSGLTAADFNGDGYTDPVIGGPIDYFYSGLIGMFPGSSSPSGGALSDAALTIEGDLGMLTGGDLDAMADINGDGLPELLVGSGYAITEGSTLEVNDGPAEAYLFLSPGTSGSLGLGNASVTFEGPQRAFGLQVEALPDVTGDGWPDVFISSGEEDESAYLFRGPGY